MSTLLDRWVLQYRITASLGLGLSVILLLFAAVASWSIGQATDAALRERQALAVALAGLLSGQEDFDQERLSFHLAAGQRESALRLEVLDGAGSVAASTTPDRLGTLGPHAALLADLIANRRPGVRPHHPPSSSGRAPHVVAYAPLSLPGTASAWGITVEQDEDVVLALPRRLRDRMAAAGALALLVASTLAWTDVRRVVRPLRAVTAAAQRIAAGDLTVALGEIAPRRQDEVGRLTIALETMRGRLVQSLAEISEWSHQLERRVEQRTRELAALETQRRQLLSKVIWAQEEERKRLARELHDEPVQTLSAVAMALQAIEDGLPLELTRDRERLAWAKEQAIHAARDIRQLILDLRPSVLDDLGLVPAVRWYAGTHLEHLGIAVTLQAPETPVLLPPAIQITAFRVLQEAIANVAKHAGARHVVIRIHADGEALEAAVHDDGRGFDPSAVRAASAGRAERAPVANGSGPGLGLLGMEERVALLGGQLAVHTAPGAGTRVQFAIPLRTADGRPFDKLRAGSPTTDASQADSAAARQALPLGGACEQWA